MKVRLTNFKCHKYFEFSLPDSGLVLLDGPSGAGKSTVLNSLPFLLNNKGRVSGCNVSLEHDSISIMRMKNPHKLVVNTGDREIIDDEAQCWIDENFNISYVYQSGFDSFLTASYIDRRSCLEKMVGFENDYTHRVEDNIAGLVKSCDSKKDEIEIQTRLLKSILPEPLEYIAEDDRILDDIKHLESVRDDMRLEMSICRQNMEKKKLAQRLFSVSEEIASLGLSLEDHKLDNEQYENSKKLDRKRKLEETIENLDKDGICEKIEHIKRLKIENDNYKSIIDNSNVIIKMLDGLEAENILGCPWDECNRPIEIINNRLERSTKAKSCDMILPSKTTRKRTPSESLRLAEAKMMLQTKKPLEFDERELKSLENQKNVLMRYEYELENIGNVYEGCYDIEALEKKVRKHETDVKRLKMLEIEAEALGGMDLSIDGCVNVDDTRVKLAEIDLSISSLHKRLKAIEEYKIYRKKLDQVEEYEVMLRDATAKKISSSVLKTCWIEAKTECIDQIVNVLQFNVNELVTRMFEGTISIVISCWKPATKSRGEKAGFEIGVCLNNKTLSINDLSGGEKSRVSIAFSCALASMNGSKLLLLDESVSGLDLENVEKVLNVLRDWSVKYRIPVLLVSHNATRGTCDKIIKL